MYKIEVTKQFEKDVKLSQKRGLNINLLKEVINILAKEGKLPAKYKPHKLSGNYSDFWECHIKADWLLIWKQDDDKLILLFVRSGTHSDLF